MESSGSAASKVDGRSQGSGGFHDDDEAQGSGGSQNDADLRGSGGFMNDGDAVAQGSGGFQNDAVAQGSGGFKNDGGARASGRVDEEGLRASQGENVGRPRAETHEIHSEGEVAASGEGSPNVQGMRQPNVNPEEVSNTRDGRELSRAQTNQQPPEKSVGAAPGSAPASAARGAGAPQGGQYAEGQQPNADEQDAEDGWTAGSQEGRPKHCPKRVRG